MMQLQSYNGLACELKTMKNQPVTPGQILEAGEGALQVQSPLEALPDLPVGIKLKLVVYEADGGFLMLAGRVAAVHGGRVSLTGVTNVKEYEKRRFYRVDTGIGARVWEVEGAIEHGPIPVRIKNLSLSGMLFQSERLFHPEAELRIDPSFFAPEIDSMHAVVLRGQKLRDGMAYGADFVDLPSWQEDLLCNFIFDLQRRQIRGGHR